MRRLVLALVVSSLGACTAEPSVEPSSLKVVIHDAPADVQEVWVEFDSVTAHHADAGWLTVSEGARAVDLLTLQGGVFAELGLAVLAPGHYDQLRLGITRAWVVDDGVSHDLAVPSGSESGLKVVHGFDVLECGQTTLSLDWDVGAHLHHNDQGYALRPVLFVDAVTTEGCGPVLVERTQELHNEWTIGVWDYFGDVAARSWQYQTYEPFDPAWGTLHKVRVDQTFDITFDLSTSIPGEPFSFRTIFAGGNFWNDGSFPIVNASEHKTYTFTQDPAGDWTRMEWGYYFETFARTTPHAIKNTARLTYIYEE